MAAGDGEALLRRADLLAWSLKLAGSTVGWYVWSISLTLFNKWILGCQPAALALDPRACDAYWVASFKFPVAMTFCHMAMKGVIAWCAFPLLATAE